MIPNPVQSAVPSQHQLSMNPMLPQHPLGAYTDSIYEAEVAQARAATQQQYNDVLRQLGYRDPATGEFILGNVEVDANMKRMELGRSKRLAQEGVTDEAQRAGTLYSGRRGTNTARAEHPMVAALGDLDVQVPRELAALYEQVQNIMGGFNTQHGLLLAQTAARAAEKIRNQPAAAAPVAPDGDPAGQGPGTLAPVDLRGNATWDPNTGEVPTANMLRRRW